MDEATEADGVVGELEAVATELGWEMVDEAIAVDLGW